MDNNAFPGEQSPFMSQEMTERLELFLSSYGAVAGKTHFGCSELIGTAIARLDAIAAWTEEFVRSHGNTALADHAVMYRNHSQWLFSWGDLREQSR